jgi:peptidoglycan/xylan/chitin deacetylase (PgdA/CDA1 family)
VAARTSVKQVLGVPVPRRPAAGLTVLLYHRVGGGTADELDVAVDAFDAQLDVLAGHRVVSIDIALDELAAGDASPKVVLTFDDGWADVYTHAWPRLREQGLPFTVYPVASCVGGALGWGGTGGPALTWDQLAEMAASGLCTVGNHTDTHAAPDDLTDDELDRCSEAVTRALGQAPNHFAYPWGIEVPGMRAALAVRFRSAATGAVGRNLPGADPLSLRRVPVRRSDPLPFFRAKLGGRLLPERAYAGLVTVAKRALNHG